MNLIQRFPHRASLLSFGLAVITLAPGSSTAVAASPNIVLMYIDNLGYGA